MLALDHPGLKGRPWVHVGQAGPILGPSWAYRGANVGPMLAYVGSMLALCWPMLAISWPMLALSWPYVGPMLAYVGPMLARLGAYVEAMLAICETISVERPPRCQFFLPGSVRGTKNHVKTTVLHFRQQKKCLSKHAKHCTERCFCYLTRTKHRKIRWLQSVRLSPMLKNGAGLRPAAYGA